ncbi:hypothetical protein HPB50_021324 [Hyalomma asiaticum]|uniref:Uncharacterized protein n=1 Tax=Hyalomma asiaticum TaxID=266040 RepID=A0ACB7S8D8_HYAAI|nr:hypothetical protein HPB50_021324 [Hyalomma asiaticum]
MEPKSHHRICSQHFRKSCFYAGLDRPSLRPDAVPTEFSSCREKARNNATKNRSPVTPSVTSLPHGRTTRAATKMQEKEVANQAAKQLKTKDTGTNMSSTLGKDAPAQAASSEGQILPKKRLFQLRHETKGQSGGQAKVIEDAASTSKPAPARTEQKNSAAINGSKDENPEQDNESNCSDEQEEHRAVDKTVNRNLDSGKPGPETTATGALFLHTYCGERTEPEAQEVQLRKLLQVARRRLAVAERTLKRKTVAFNELLAANKELKFELSMAQRPAQQQFSVSDRLPQELLRDWHENAGRVPHARRYSATTLRFAADLHACSRTAYEHVARWLPMPTLYLVRRHTAMSSSVDRSQDSGTVAASTTPSATRETTSAGPEDTNVPASRFASSVPRFRKSTSGFLLPSSKPSASTLPPAQCAAQLEKPPVMQASHSAPAVFVINNATPPDMATPLEAAVLPEMVSSTEVATSSEMNTLSNTEEQPVVDVEVEMDTHLDIETQPGDKMQETSTEALSRSFIAETVTNAPAVQTVTALYLPNKPPL